MWKVLLQIRKVPENLKLRLDEKKEFHETKGRMVLQGVRISPRSYDSINWALSVFFAMHPSSESLHPLLQQGYKCCWSESR